MLFGGNGNDIVEGDGGATGSTEVGATTCSAAARATTSLPVTSVTIQSTAVEERT